MDAAELGRRRAAGLHDDAAAAGCDPRDPYGFAVAQAGRLGVDVEGANPGAAALDGGRASYVPTDGLIVHETVGSPFDQAFLVSHEIGHLVLGDHGPDTVRAADPMRPAEPSPIGFDRVIDYGRRQRREVQMDLFAREFLLPRHVVRRMHLEGGLSASEIARVMRAPFDVVTQQLLDALLLPPIESVVDAPRAEPPLNRLQAVAASHRGGPYLLEAGPGTGKTQTLAGRIDGLLAEGVDARRILVLTFSNKAAREMAERIARKNPEAAAAMWVGTFHAFGLDLVRRFGSQLGLPAEPRMMDRTEAVELLEAEFPRLRLRHYRNLYDPTRQIADILAAVSRAKDEVVDEGGYARLARLMLDAAVGDDQIAAAEKAAEVALVYQAYEALKRRERRIDFGDLVSLPVRLLEGDAVVRATLHQAYDHVLVDEYQDVNRASVRLLEALCPQGRNLWAVGDVKQSIYRFRGASSFNVARFGVSDFPGGVRGRLEVNYRSTKEVTDAFSAFASSMRVARGNVALEADRGPSGSPPELLLVAQADQQVVAVADGIQEMRAAGHAYRDQAVLCTGNEKLSSIGRDLERLGIPVLFLGSLFERPEVKDLISLLSLLVDGRAMGIVRVGAMAEFPLSLADVGIILDRLRPAGATGAEWLATFDPAALSPEGRNAIATLSQVLAGFDEAAPPWPVLAAVLLDRTRIVAGLAAQGVAGRSRGIAIWQFMNFLRAQPPGRGLPIRRLVDRIRRLVRIGDDRDLRQLPAAALGLDAVRLMTIHVAKGLEFPVVHVPGMNRDTLPGSPRTPPCLQPDGMVAGAWGDALSAYREGEAEERECLFYVAASRTQDRLFLYAVTSNALGHARPLSPFLDRLGPALGRRQAEPSRLLPAAPEAACVELRIDGSLRFGGSQLALYESCPRRFLYTHVLRIGGRRTETAYMQMHEAVRAVVTSVVSGGIDIGDDDALVRHVARACAEKGLGGGAARDELQAAAADMVRYFLSTRTGRSAERPLPLLLVIAGDEVTFDPDDVLVSAGGERSFRRVRTGHRRSDEDSDVGAAAFLLAARSSHAGAVVELVHLSDAAVTPLEFTPRVLGNRRGTLSGLLAKIRAGSFPAKQTERTCPGCPAFFVCGPMPAGPLEIKF